MLTLLSLPRKPFDLQLRMAVPMHPPRVIGLFLLILFSGIICRMKQCLGAAIQQTRKNTVLKVTVVYLALALVRGLYRGTLPMPGTVT